MSNCTRNLIFGGVNLHFRRNESNVQMYKNPNFLVESIYILGEMKCPIVQVPQFLVGPNYIFEIG